MQHISDEYYGTDDEDDYLEDGEDLDFEESRLQDYADGFGYYED